MLPKKVKKISLKRFNLKSEAKAAISQIGHMFSHDHLSKPNDSGKKYDKRNYSSPVSEKTFKSSSPKKEFSPSKTSRFLSNPLKIASHSPIDLKKPLLYEENSPQSLQTSSSLSSIPISPIQSPGQEIVMDWRPTTSWWTEGSGGSKFIECIEPKVPLRDPRKNLLATENRTPEINYEDSQTGQETLRSNTNLFLREDSAPLDKMNLSRELAQHKIEWEAMLSLQQADPSGILKGLSSRQIRRLIRESASDNWLIRTHGPLLEEGTEFIDSSDYESNSETVSVDCISAIVNFGHSSEFSEEGTNGEEDLERSEKAEDDYWLSGEGSRMYFQKQSSFNSSDQDSESTSFIVNPTKKQTIGT